MKLPIHRWYRYSAGYSADWVESELESEDRGKTILDPFAGSATTLIKAQELGFSSIGLESHPFVYTIAKGKLLWDLSPQDCNHAANQVLERAQSELKQSPKLKSNTPDLLTRCYEKENLVALFSLKNSCQQERDEDIRDWLKLALTAILRVTSTAGTAPWQYVLPKRSKAKVLDALTAFRKQTELMCSDMSQQQNAVGAQGRATLHHCDARDMHPLMDNTIDLVLTSPPYANNYDYADATRLEVTFWFDHDWKQEQQRIKQSLMRSCSQHSSNLKEEAQHLLNSELLKPIKRTHYPI